MLVRTTGLDTVTGSSRTTLVRTTEDTLFEIEVLEQINKVVLSSSDRSGSSATSELIFTTVDNCTSSLNSLCIVSVSVLSLHLSKVTSNSNVSGVQLLEVPVLRNRSSLQSNASLESQSSILVSTHVTTVVNLGHQTSCLAKLSDNPVVSSLLSRTGNIKTCILLTIVLVVERSLNDRHTTVSGYTTEVAVSTDEESLTLISLVVILSNNLLLNCAIESLDELVDRTHITVAPPAVDTTSTIRWGRTAAVSEEGAIVARAKCTHRDVTIEVSQKTLQTCLRAEKVLSSHLAQVTLEVVEDLVARSHAERQDCCHNIYKYFFHTVHSD